MPLLPPTPETPGEPLGDEPRGDPSIAALFSQLIDHAERFIRAEFRLYRADLISRMIATRAAIVMILIAFLLSQASIIALLVGLIVILRHPLGAVGATTTVVGGALIIVALLGSVAFAKISRATKIEDKPK